MAVRQATSFNQVFILLGLKPGGSALLKIKALIKEAGLSIAHFTKTPFKGKQTNKPPPHKKNLVEVLVQNSNYQNTSSLKGRLLAEGFLENKCYICNILPLWQSKVLVMRLDHINGDRTDNRLENLRLLCPNCDSQTPTFCGRNKLRT